MTEGKDIGFVVSRQTTNDGVEEELIPMERLNSHMVPEDGSILCSKPGTCKFI